MEEGLKVASGDGDAMTEAQQQAAHRAALDEYLAALGDDPEYDDDDDLADVDLGAPACEMGEACESCQ